MVRIQIIGHIGQDATVRDVNGMSAISFNVASTETYKNKQGEKVNDTTWVSCTMWRKNDQLGIVPYLKKGTQVFCEGKPGTNAWINSSENKAMSTLTLRVNDLRLLGAAGGNNNNNTQQQQGNNTPAANNTQANPTSNNIYASNIADDDLPF